jgi:hypothetical protein
MKRLERNGKLKIEGLASHSAETIERVRALLEDGTTVHEDPRRQNFYEVHDGQVAYYIYVSPRSGKVHLLGILQDEPWPMTV